MAVEPVARHEDDFEFRMTYDEYLDIIFEGLELPNMTKESDKGALYQEPQRAGFTSRGVPTNINLRRTMINRLARIAALAGPRLREAEELEEELEYLNTQLDTSENMDRRDFIVPRIKELRDAAAKVPFLEELDFKYDNRIMVDKPITQGLMICTMDVSGSMTEEHKVMAKKFYLLLNRFLRRKYEKVEVVFIRHHDEARECSEIEFFLDRDSGGTMVSTSYEVVSEVLKRYPQEQWNVYMAQVSDGDMGWVEDKTKCLAWLKENMDRLQFMMYMEVDPENYRGQWFNPNELSDLMEMLKGVQSLYPDKLFADKVTGDDQIVPIFRRMFEKRYSSKTSKPSMPLVAKATA